MDKTNIVFCVLTALYGMYIAIALYVTRRKAWRTRLLQWGRRSRLAARIGFAVHDGASRDISAWKRGRHERIS